MDQSIGQNSSGTQYGCSSSRKAAKPIGQRGKHTGARADLGRSFMTWNTGERNLLKRFQNPFEKGFAVWEHRIVLRKTYSDKGCNAGETVTRKDLESHHALCQPDEFDQRVCNPPVVKFGILRGCPRVSRVCSGVNEKKVGPTVSRVQS